MYRRILCTDTPTLFSPEIVVFRQMHGFNQSIDFAHGACVRMSCASYSQCIKLFPVHTSQSDAHHVH